MTLDVSSSNFAIVSFIIGLVGTGLAIYQTLAARKVRSLYEANCKDRCKDIVSLVRNLSGGLISECERVQRSRARLMRNLVVPGETAAALSKTSGAIASAMTVTIELVRFCERLNDGHEDEFGYKVYNDSELADLRDEACRVRDLCSSDEQGAMYL